MTMRTDRRIALHGTEAEHNGDSRRTNYVLGLKHATIFAQISRHSEWTLFNVEATTVDRM